MSVWGNLLGAAASAAAGAGNQDENREDNEGRRENDGDGGSFASIVAQGSEAVSAMASLVQQGSAALDSLTTTDSGVDAAPYASTTTAPMSYAAAAAAAVEPSDEAASYPTSSYTAEAAAAETGDVEAAVGEALEAAGDSVQAAASQLWGLDAGNRLESGVDYTVNTQLKAYSYDEDHAHEAFVSWISEAVWSRGTYGSFRRLLDNYVAETGVPERVSSEEREEEETFLDQICETGVIRFVQQWLWRNLELPCASSMSSFRDALYDMWFALYARDGARDSSGFEHAFCGELDDGKVKGLHNLIQVVVEEGRGNFDYMGFLSYGRERGDEVEDEDRVLTIRFKWLGQVKSASSMFVGVSPEFEIALYSLMWLAGAAGQTVKLGACDVRVKVYEMHGKIAAAFPELVGVDYDESY